MEYEPQYWPGSEMIYDPSFVVQHENMFVQQDCYPNYQLMANGEYLLTTGRDFLEYPELNYEECYMEDDGLSYNASSDEDDCTSVPSSLEHHPSLNNNTNQQNNQEEEEEEGHEPDSPPPLPLPPSEEDTEEAVMDTKKQLNTSLGHSGYPPPPLSNPPRLHYQKPHEHRSPPAGGLRRSSSPNSSSSGNRKSHSPPETKSLKPQLRHGDTPPGASPNSSPPIVTRSDSTTPTNELGERGSPAGSSSNNTNKHTHQSKIPRSIESVNSGRSLGTIPTPSYHGSVKMLYNSSDANRRQSPPRLSGQIPESRSDYRLFKPTKSLGFTRRHTVSVADRIAQFGGQRKVLQRTYSPENRGGANSGGIGGLDPYKDIDIEDKLRQRNNTDNEGVVKGGLTNNEQFDKMTSETTISHLEQISASENGTKVTPPLTTSAVTPSHQHQPLSPSSTNPTMSSYSMTQPDRQDDLVSPTSSIEELSFINQRRDLVHKSHESLAPPTNQQYRVVHNPHHQVGGGYPIQPNPQKPIHSGGTTFIPRPPQPHANVPPSSTVVYPYSSTDHHSEPAGSSYPPVLMKNSSQPLGIATANLALAQNAAAKGELTTLRSLISNNDLDPVCCSQFGSNLLHTAAGNGQLQVLQLLGKEVSPTAFQVADNNYLTPAMLAIQGGYVDCLKWLVEEGGVSLTVPDAGGETLLHHAAFNGQVMCLDYLLHRLDTTSEQVSYFDESGVTPAHFAAQRGQIDCLSLLISYNYDVIMPDRENQKPSDWADAMGHRTCTHYLLMYEMCWQLSREVAMLSQQVQRLYYDNEQLYDALKSRDKEHSTEIAQLLKQHQVTIQKVHEKYANYTVSLLLNEGKDQPNNVGGASSTTDTPPSETKISSTNPSKTVGTVNVGSSPEHNATPDNNHLNKEKKERSKPPPLEIPPATPDEVLKRQLSNVEQQLFANRQVRKLHPVMATLSFSPLSPVLKKMSLSQEKLMEEAMNPSEKEKRSVTFAPSVTEYIVGGTPLANDHRSAHIIDPPHLHKSNSSHISTHHSSSQIPVLPKPVDNYHDNHHQPHPSLPSFHPHKQYQFNMYNSIPNYQTPNGSSDSQQPRSHSKLGTKDGKPVNLKQGVVKGKDGTDSKEDITVKQQPQQSSKHVAKQPVSSGGNLPANSRGGPQQENAPSNAIPVSSASQKNTQLQQQLKKLQQLENLKQSKPDRSRQDKHMVHQQQSSRSGSGPSILYRPVEGGGGHSGKKRVSMPLPMTTGPPPHPSPHHRSSVPMQRVSRTSKDMGHGAGGLPPGVQPHPLSVSQGASGSNRSSKHSVPSYK